jgi:cysteinyl-tRNA synthetase
VLSEDEQQGAPCPGCARTSTVEELRGRVRFPGLEDADDRLAYVYETLRGAREFLAASKKVEGEGPVVESIEHVLAQVVEAMRDDLNTSAAIAKLSEPLSEINRLVASKKGVDKAVRWRSIDRFVRDMGEVSAMLGLFAHDPDGYLRDRRDRKAARIHLDVDRVEDLLRQRTQAREAKDWARADAIRGELDALGVTVRDGPEGSIWTL